MKAFSLEGHAALVTGSSQGIGAAIAQGLEDCGATVVRHGLKNEPAFSYHFNAKTCTCFADKCPYKNG